MSKRKRPKSEVRCSVRYGVQHEFDCFNHLVDENLVKTMMSIISSFTIQDLFISADICLSFVILLWLDQLILFRFVRLSPLTLFTVSGGILLVGAACSAWNDTEHEWDGNKYANNQCGTNFGLIREEFDCNRLS